MASVTIAATTVVFAGTLYNLPQTVLSLVEGRNVVFATQTAIQVTQGDVPRTTAQLPMWDLTLVNGKVQGAVDLRTTGGVDLTKYVYNQLPRANHHVDIQNTINVGGGIDFSYSQHRNKTIDYVGDGTQFLRQSISPSIGLNEIENPSFEISPGPGETGPVHLWGNMLGGTAGFTVAQEFTAGFQHSGSADLLLSVNPNTSIPANTTYYTTLSPVRKKYCSPGDKLVVGAWFTAAANIGTPAGLTPAAYVNVRWFDKSGASLGDVNCGGAVSLANPGATYKLFANAIAAPTGAASYLLYIESTVANSTGAAVSTPNGQMFDVRCDDVFVKKIVGSSVIAGGAVNDSGDVFDANNGGDGTRLLLTRHQSDVAISPSRNLVKNGRFALNSGGNFVGWSWYGGANFTQMDGGNVQSIPTLHIRGSAGSGAGITQTINVEPGMVYSFATIIYNNNGTSGTQYGIWIGDPTYSTQYNSESNGLIQGTVPPFYASVGPIRNGLRRSQSAPSTQYEVLCGTFSVPAGKTSAAVLLYNFNGAACDFYASSVAVWRGSKWQDYIENDGGAFDKDGFLTHSTSMNNQGSILNFAGTPTYPYTVTSSSITFNMPAATYTRTDLSTFTVPAQTIPFTGLGASYPYYFDIAVDIASMSYVASINGAGGFSKAQQITDAYRDGRIPIVTNYQITTVATGQPSGGGTGGTGGGGGGPQCPADYQIVETRERGMIRADEVDVGMHFRAPFGSGRDWVRVNDAVRLPTTLWSFTIASSKGEETFDVNETHACKRPDGSWLVVSEMQAGDALLGNGEDLRVVAARKIGPGYFIGFDVEGHEFRMGQVCVHNVTTI